MLKAVFVSIFLFVVAYSVFAMGNAPLFHTQDANALVPNFTLETTSGVTKTLSESRGGKKAVLFFWATWCPHCHEQLTKMASYQEEWKAKGIVAVLVNLGESREEVQAYLTRNNSPWESFLDEENSLQEVFAIRGLPTLHFINEEGYLQAVTHGLPEDIDAAFPAKAN